MNIGFRDPRLGFLSSSQCCMWLQHCLWSIYEYTVLSKRTTSTYTINATSSAGVLSYVKLTQPVSTSSEACVHRMHMVWVKHSHSFILRIWIPACRCTGKTSQQLHGGKHATRNNCKIQNPPFARFGCDTGRVTMYSETTVHIGNSIVERMLGELETRREHGWQETIGIASSRLWVVCANDCFVTCHICWKYLVLLCIDY